MDEEITGQTNLIDSSSAATFVRLTQHLQNPQNLITYMMFTAWMKFMGIASHIPTITIGG